jgi:hypothetical protein
MTSRVVEHKIKLEKSVKVILGVLAFGVFLNAFAPAFDVRKASAVELWNDGSKGQPIYIVCKSGCN